MNTKPILYVIPDEHFDVVSNKIPDKHRVIRHTTFTKIAEREDLSCEFDMYACITIIPATNVPITKISKLAARFFETVPSVVMRPMHKVCRNYGFILGKGNVVGNLAVILDQLVKRYTFAKYVPDSTDACLDLTSQELKKVVNTLHDGITYCLSLDIHLLHVIVLMQHIDYLRNITKPYANYGHTPGSRSTVVHVKEGIYISYVGECATMRNHHSNDKVISIDAMNLFLERYDSALEEIPGFKGVCNLNFTRTSGMSMVSMDIYNLLLEEYAELWNLHYKKFEWPTDLTTVMFAWMEFDSTAHIRIQKGTDSHIVEIQAIIDDAYLVETEDSTCE